MRLRTFFRAVLAIDTVVLCRRPDIRKCEVDFVDDALHGRQDQRAKAILGVRAFGHYMGLERDESLGVCDDLLLIGGICWGESSDLREDAKGGCRSHVEVEAENQDRHD